MLTQKVEESLVDKFDILITYDIYWQEHPKLQ
jgi:hypothetical protein